MNKDKHKDIETTSLGSGKRYLCYGQGMQNNLIKTNAAFIRHVARKFSKSTKESLIAGTLVVTEVEISKLHKFKTKDEYTDHFEKLDFRSKKNIRTQRMITKN